MASAAGLCMVGMALSGCGSITADSAAGAQIRFVDLSVDAPAMDLYLNGGGAAYNLSFGTVTSYVAVSPGEYRVSANRANTTQALVSARTALGGTRQYTAVVSNTLGALQEAVYPDASAAAPAGIMALRVLHGASGAGAVDMYVTPSGANAGPLTAVARDLGYLGDGGYVNLPAGTSYTVLVVPAGAANPAASGGVLSGITVNGGSGAVRTLVLSDPALAKGKGLNGFVLNDVDTP